MAAPDKHKEVLRKGLLLLIVPLKVCSRKEKNRVVFNRSIYPKLIVHLKEKIRLVYKS